MRTLLAHHLAAFASILILAGVAPLQAQPLTTVRVDLNSGAFRKELPFDIPFNIRGGVEPVIERVCARYKEVGKDAPPEYPPLSCEGGGGQIDGKGGACSAAVRLGEPVLPDKTTRFWVMPFSS